jgi:hypothetical protein
MTATFNPPTKLAPYTYLLTWSGIAPFRVFDYYNYRYLKTNTEDTQLYLTSPFIDQCIAVQVADAEDPEVDGETYHGIARVQWRGVTHAVRYAVDNGLTILNYTPESGQGYYDFAFSFPQLFYIDDAIISITSYDSEGNTVATQANAASLVSLPLMFEYTLTYNSGTNTITVGI